MAVGFELAKRPKILSQLIMKNLESTSLKVTWSGYSARNDAKGSALNTIRRDVVTFPTRAPGFLIA
jgi:hypothetical protein